MNALFEATYVIPVVNLINTIVNVYWSIKLKSIQGNGELLRDLREQNKTLTDLNKDYKEETRSYKLQFHNLLGEYQKMKGQLESFHKLHNVDK